MGAPTQRPPGTDRALVLGGLQAARAVVPHAAAGVPLPGSLLLDQLVDLLVLTHAGGELGPQVDQRLLQAGRGFKPDNAGQRKPTDQQVNRAG